MSGWDIEKPSKLNKHFSKMVSVILGSFHTDVSSCFLFVWFEFVTSRYKNWMINHDWQLRLTRDWSTSSSSLYRVIKSVIPDVYRCSGTILIDLKLKTFCFCNNSSTLTPDLVKYLLFLSADLK